MMLSLSPNIGIAPATSLSPIIARLQYDNSIRNCFGYLSEDHQNIYESVNSLSSVTGNYGFFLVCVLRPNETDSAVILQIFFADNRRSSFLLSASLPILSLNGSFSNANKLNNGEMVVLRMLPESALIRCESIVINPLEGDDWNKIISSAAQAEELLLGQLRAVQAKMRICIHFKDGKIASFSIEDILPNTQVNNCNGNGASLSSHPSVFLLSVGTRVLVAALNSTEKLKKENKKEEQDGQEMGLLTGMTAHHEPFSDCSITRPIVSRVLFCSIADFVPFPHASSCSNPFFAAHHRFCLLLNTFPFVFVPYGTCTERKDPHALLTCCVCVQLDHEKGDDHLAEAVLVELPQSTQQMTTTPFAHFCDQLSLMITRFRHSSGLHHCCISPALSRFLCCRSIELQWIRINPIPQNQLKTIDNLVICSTIRGNSEEVRQTFTELVTSSRELYAPWLFPKCKQNWILRLKTEATDELNPNKKQLFVKLLDGDEKMTENANRQTNAHLLIWPLSPKVTFEFREDEESCGQQPNESNACYCGRNEEAETTLNQSLQECCAQMVEFPAQQFVLSSLSHSVRTFLHRFLISATNPTAVIAGEGTLMPLALLLEGTCGSGKSTVLPTLANNLRVPAENGEFVPVAVQCVDCSTVGNSFRRSVDSIDTAMDKLVKRWPSALFLDNFDTFVEKISVGGAFSSFSAQNEELTKRLLYRKIFDKLFGEDRRKMVPVVCAISDGSQLLEAWDGLPFKSEVHRIGPIGKDTQKEVLSKLLAHGDTIGLIPQIESANFATIGELLRLVEKLELQRIAANRSAVVSRFDSDDILSVASICRRHEFGEGELSVRFDQIAGLESVKKRLVELFIWPARYSTLFALSGLRVGHRTILYGPSGCGKSMLLRALAREMDANVFTVRGPQLLSKYIGQSEQNVRQLFAKGKASKPSLIIFDEIDAIAPQRGSDNAHVTDRMVNQMLTELDGFEGGTEGVFVLAVTNRIDLVDKALLRPGRFDFKLNIGLPDCELRLAILRLYSAKEWGVHLSDNVNLKLIAQQTEGFSGAEIRATVQNALHAAEREHKKDGNFGRHVPRVCQKHFNWAIEHFGKKLEKGVTTGGGALMKQKLTFHC